MEAGRPLRILVLKPRQKGSSTGTTGLAYHHLSNRVQNGGIVGGDHQQGENLMRMIKTYAENDPFAGANSCRISIGSRKGEWKSGSRIEQRTAGNEEVGRSSTYQFLLCTEVARWAEQGVANAADVLAGILKCVPNLPETVVILESTAGGASGDFYDRWIGAMEPEEWMESERDGFVRVFAPWFAFDDSVQSAASEGIHSEEDYTAEERERAARHELSMDQVAWWRWALREECGGDENKFAQDYPWDWESAFLTSGQRRFNEQRMREMRDSARVAVPETGMLDRQEDGNVTFRAVDASEAWVWIWERPLDGCRYLLSVDPATGASQTVGADPDAHGVFVLRAGYFDGRGVWRAPKAVARMRAGAQWDIDILEAEVAKLADCYGGCLIVPEGNMDRGLIELLKQRGMRIYERRQWNRRDQKLTNQLGWQTSAETREPIIEGLARVIREQGTDGDGFELLCPAAIEQMMAFIRKASGRSEARAGKHDDDVLALAIGLACLDGATVYRVARRKVARPADWHRWRRWKP
jgi:hypothetical protein